MNEVPPAKRTLADRVRGWFDARYAAQSAVARYVEQHPRSWFKRFQNSYRSGDERRTDSTSWSSQPWAPDGDRTLTPGKRRSMVKRAREVDENNLLGSSMLDRTVDNVIGWQMTLQSSSQSQRWRRNVEAAWRDYQHEADARQMMTLAELQRTWYRARLRDGDIGILLLRNGALQTIESDYVQSPYGAGDLLRQPGDPETVDGVEINGIGRPLGFHVAALQGDGTRRTARIPQRNMVWYPRVERSNKTAVRGVPLLAQLGPLLDQIDGTVEGVTMAYRMAALFGVVIKRSNPAAAFGALPNTVTNASGNDQTSIELEPAMVEYLGQDDSIEQVRPEHPTASFSDFMAFLIRVAGVKLGLPLELALLDFSRTNYSSARASMEQSYRKFRIEQQIFAHRVLRRIYRWRVSKWINDGVLPNAPSDALEHRWLGQPWPYLDPVKDVQGDLVAVDAGAMTLSEMIMKRSGMDFEEWLTKAAEERDRRLEEGIPIMHSNLTRDETTGNGAGPASNEGNGDETDE